MGKEVYKKVFLENLPKDKKGRILWVETIGHKVRFVYDDIDDYVLILEVKERNMLVLKYKENENFEIYADNFKKCALGKMLKKQTKDFKFEIGKIFKDDKKDFVITDREYRQREGFSKGKSYTINDKYYKYKCNKCGWTEGWVVEGTLLKGCGCACCDNKIVVEGINDIPTTAPWMIKYFQGGYNEAKQYTKNSGLKIKPICPDCGRIKEKPMEIYVVNILQGIGCSCGDGYSYPEKFMINILSQLNVDFETQLSKKNFTWCDKYKYDFYLPDYNMIIETHGLQHYVEQSKKSRFKLSLKEQQENDRLKQELAIKNGINDYIVVDCRYSELEWIKGNVMKSKLSNMFDLSKIDWNKCEEFALKNIVKEVCEYWEKYNDYYTVNDLANTFRLSNTTIRNYLNKGNDLGWCCYDGKEEKKMCSIKKQSKKVAVFKKDEFLGVFPSVKKLSEKSKELFGINISKDNIYSVCNDRLKTYKGFTFKYV